MLPPGRLPCPSTIGLTPLRSIRYQLLRSPEKIVVHTGHGDSTTIGDERERVFDRMTELGIN